MIEQEVRDMLQSKVRHAPPLDEPPAKVMRRARGRRALNTAGLAVGLAVVAVGSWIGAQSLGTTPIEQLTRLPVPWKAIPNGPLGIGGIDPCRVSDVRLSADAGPGAALGFTARTDLVRCGIDPGFSVELFDAAGRKLDVPVRFAKTFPGVVVENSEATRVAFFEWANGCAPTTGPIRFRVGLPKGGGQLTATARNGGEVDCTGSRSNTSMTFKTGGSRPSGYVRRDALDTLAISLSQVPRTVAAGTQLRYLVTMSNLTDIAVPLDPCPDYTQGLTILDNSLSHGQTNKLNCADAPSVIPPHSLVVFEMRFHIPSGANAAPAELSWSFTRPGFGRVDEVKTRISVTRA